MAGKVVKFLNETYGKKSLIGSLKAGGWKALIDGNLAETTLIHSPGAVLKGVDQFGNKYYERMTEDFGRHRWVVYGDLSWPEGQDPTIIPPEWHGWINHISDATPTEANFHSPIYAITHKPLKTGSEQAYLPKGAWKHPQKRNWIKFTAWQPPTT